jgi:hypothetical protein
MFEKKEKDFASFLYSATSTSIRYIWHLHRRECEWDTCWRVIMHNLASKSVPFTLTAVQVPNLALTHTNRITMSTYPHLCKKKRTFQTCYVAPNCWIVQGVHFTDNIHIRYLPFIPAYNRIYSTNNREVITEQQQQHVLHKTSSPNCTKSFTN